MSAQHTADNVLTVEPIARTEAWTIYDVANVAGIDLMKLSYFALSVFWRAAATDWPVDNELIPRLDLGKTYTDALKHRPLGNTLFPANMALNVAVCDSPTLAATTLAIPSGGKDCGYWSYGLRFPASCFVCSSVSESQRHNDSAVSEAAPNASYCASIMSSSSGSRGMPSS
jgi:hypothetical protein